MSNFKSICFCLDVWYPYLGGGQDRVFNLAKQLSKTHQVTIITRNLGSFRGHHLPASVNLVQLGTAKPFNDIKGRIQFVFQSLIYFKKHQFDFIDFQPYSPWITAWLLKFFKPRQKMAITLLGQGNHVTGMPNMVQPLFQKIYRHLIYQVSWPLVISDTQQALRKIKKSPVKIIPNGVSMSDYKLKPNKSQPQSLVFLGRFHPQKGVDVLLQAFSKVVTLKPQTTLTLIGTGPEKNKLVDLINKLKLSHSVAMPGQMVGEKLIKTLKSKTIFVLPSRYEGQSISLLMAMACQLPIIATKVGDNQQLITPDIGILVDPENPNQLAEAIIKLINKPSQSQQMGSQGFNKVSSNYSWKKIAQEYLLN